MCRFTRPADAQWAILFAPGYGQDSRDSKFAQLVEALTTKGFAVLQMNYRNVAASRDKSVLTLAEMIEDMQAAVDFLADQFTDIGIVAKSVSSLVFLLADLPFQSAVLWGPPVYPEDQGDGYVADVLSVQLNQISHRRGYLKLEDLQKFEQPVLIVHGSKDEISPVSNAEFLYEALPNSKLHVIEGADHGFHGRGYMEEAVRVTVDWFIQKV